MYYYPHTNSFKRHKSAPSLALESHMAMTETSFNAIATLNICNKNLTVTSRSSNQDKRLWCDLLTVRKLLVAGLGWKTSLHHVEEAQVNRQRSEELELSCLPHRLITAHIKREAENQMELLGAAQSYSKTLILPRSFLKARRQRRQHLHFRFTH